MMNVFINLGFSFVTFLIFTLIELSVYKNLAEIFFGICGVVFSVGMSLTMNFDFSKIVDHEIYNNNVKGIKKIRMSFIVQFILSSLSFVLYKIFENTCFFIPVSFLKEKPFRIGVFFTLAIIYSLFFFLYNFYILANKKDSLEKRYRDEAMEGLE